MRSPHSIHGQSPKHSPPHLQPFLSGRNLNSEGPPSVGRHFKNSSVHIGSSNHNYGTNNINSSILGGSNRNSLVGVGQPKSQVEMASSQQSNVLQQYCRLQIVKQMENYSLGQDNKTKYPIIKANEIPNTNNSNFNSPVKPQLNALMHRRRQSSHQPALKSSQLSPIDASIKIIDTKQSFNRTFNDSQLHQSFGKNKSHKLTSQFRVTSKSQWGNASHQITNKGHSNNTFNKYTNDGSHNTVSIDIVERRWVTSSQAKRSLDAIKCQPRDDTQQIDLNRHSQTIDTATIPNAQAGLIRRRNRKAQHQSLLSTQMEVSPVSGRKGLEHLKMSDQTDSAKKSQAMQLLEARLKQISKFRQYKQDREQYLRCMEWERVRRVLDRNIKIEQFGIQLNSTLQTHPKPVISPATISKHQFRRINLIRLNQQAIAHHDKLTKGIYGEQK